MTQAAGVIFFAVSEETYFKLRELERALAENDIKAVWSSGEYHGETVPTLEVFENGNLVAPYLAVMSK